MGFSGGPDSTCLLHLLHACGYDVIGAHLHHGQRPEADADLAHCEKFCENLGIPFVSGRADVPKIAQDHKISIEEAGRNARYSFFKQSAFRLNADFIATGHNKNDNVETVIFQLTRGTGLSGLAGIPRNREAIIRPLLDFSRSEIENYCKTHELPTLIDSGNHSLEFSRVRIRKNVLPELESINGALLDNVHRSTQIIAAEDQFLDAMAARILEQSEIPLNRHLNFLTLDCEAAFRIHDLLSQPNVLLVRSLRLAAKFLGSNLDQNQTELLVQSLQKAESGAITSSQGKIAIEFDNDSVHFRKLENKEPFRFPLTFPGETISDIFGYKITAESSLSAEIIKDMHCLAVSIDASKTKGGLHLRSYETGEKLQPLGMHNTKLISHILSDQKLTLAAKQRLPIIADMVGAIWIPGCTIADRVKITDATQKAIRLKIEPLHGGQGS